MDFALCARGNLTPEEAIALADSGDYVMETKVDGVRARIVKDKGQIRIFTRNGELGSYQFGDVFETIRGIAVVPGKKLILDGELCSSDLKFATVQRAIASKSAICKEIVFYAFDVLSYAEDDTYRYNYLLRHTILKDIAGISNLIATLNNDDVSLSGKSFLDLIRNLGKEGVVLKKKSDLYVPGYSRAWQRCKFTDTISAFPLDVRDDLMVDLGVTGHDGQVIRIGAVQVPEDDLMLLLAKDLTVVVEVEAYGVNENRKLRHPVYKGCRFDLDTIACSSDQLDRLRSY